MTSCPDERKEIKRNRIKHFTKSLPRVDHIAFVTNDLKSIKDNLDKHKVFYKEDSPRETGIHQIFFFDPDGNVIEVSNCAPPIGQLRCPETSIQDDGENCESEQPLSIASYDPVDDVEVVDDPGGFGDAHDHVHHTHLAEEDDSTSTHNN
jgi:hypothetical protein